MSAESKQLEIRRLLNLYLFFSIFVMSTFIARELASAHRMAIKLECE